MSERVGKWQGAEGEPIHGVFFFQDGFHCRREIRADARAKFQITGEEYLPWDIIRCSCGKFWVLGGGYLDFWPAPYYQLIGISRRKVRQKMKGRGLTIH